MKKFLEELAKSTAYMRDLIPGDTDAERKFKEMRDKYATLLGRRALYISKVTKESRVVVLEEVRDRYIRVSYKYYGMSYSGKINVCVNYQSILCGDCRLDIE